MLARNLYCGLLVESLADVDTYMEIGSYDGEGIAMLSRTYPDKKFYSIDPFIEDGNTSNLTCIKKGEPLNEIRDEFIENIRRHRNITYFDMTSGEFIRQELYKNLSVDILFIDGDHSDEGATIDLTLAVLLSKDKRLFVVMDDLYLAGVVSALDRFRIAHPEVEIKCSYDKINSVYTAAFFYLP